MRFEQQLVDYVVDTAFEDLPDEAVATAERMLLADIGTTIAGVEADGCREIAEFFRIEGGKPEATVLLLGDKLPAQNATFVNAVMSRALDYCDAIAPGPHIGSSTIPTAIACAELIQGCSGKDFLAALVVGAELAARLNLNESAYDGFDPTGICVPFGAAAVACRLLGLDRQQTWNAFGLVLNSCGGTFQGHIDGSVGVRVNQGRTARDALVCARLARRGVTGPRNFLTGLFGYLHLYGDDQFVGSDMVQDIGVDYWMEDVAFKKYPCCAMASGSTDVALRLMHEHDFEPELIRSIELRLTPHAYGLIGHEFRIGENPTVDGQFSAQYCIASALLRGHARIRDFTAEAVNDPGVHKLVSRINVVPDRALVGRGHTAMDMEICMIDGDRYRGGIDVAPGFKGNPLSKQDHMRRFMDCVDFAPEWFPRESVGEMLALIAGTAELDDIRTLVAQLSFNRDLPKARTLQ